jgi:hypothetical protein
LERYPGHRQDGCADDDSATAENDDRYEDECKLPPLDGPIPDAAGTAFARTVTFATDLNGLTQTTGFMITCIVLPPTERVRRPALGRLEVEGDSPSLAPSWLTRSRSV